jgi:hypothetical protein
MSRTCALNILVHFQDDVQKQDLDLRPTAKASAERDTGCYILIAGVWEGTDAFVSASIVGGNFWLFSDSLSVHLTLLLSQQMGLTPCIVPYL